MGVAALTTADNDFICVWVCARRWQVSKRGNKEKRINKRRNKKRNVGKMTRRTPKSSLFCRLILHTYGCWLGSLHLDDGSMACVLVEKFIIVMWPLSWATMCWMCAITDIPAKDSQWNHPWDEHVIALVTPSESCLMITRSHRIIILILILILRFWKVSETYQRLITQFLPLRSYEIMIIIYYL